MSAVVVDTHAVVWYLAGNRKLSAKATQALDEATAASRPIHVPSICLVELTYLVEKGRLPVAARDRLLRLLDDRETPFSLVHLRNLALLAEAGAQIVPAMPAFYTMPKTLDDAINFVIGKVLDQMGIAHDLFPRWVEPKPEG